MRRLLVLGAVSMSACASPAAHTVSSAESPGGRSTPVQAPEHTSRDMASGSASSDPQLHPPGARTQGVRRVEPRSDAEPAPRVVARLDD